MFYDYSDEAKKKSKSRAAEVVQLMANIRRAYYGLDTFRLPFNDLLVYAQALKPSKSKTPETQEELDEALAAGTIDLEEFNKQVKQEQKPLTEQDKRDFEIQLGSMFGNITVVKKGDA